MSQSPKNPANHHQHVSKELIIKRALDDPTFRKELLANPEKALKDYYNIILPHGVKLHVYAETKEDLYLVIPLYLEDKLDFDQATPEFLPW